MSHQTLGDGFYRPKEPINSVKTIHYKSDKTVNFFVVLDVQLRRL